MLAYLDIKSLAPCFGLLLLAHSNTAATALPFLLLQYDAHIHLLAPLSSSSSMLLILMFASGHWLLLFYCLAAVLYAR